MAISIDQIRELHALVEQLRTQDNACTAHPVFVVQKKVRDYGFDTAHDDGANIVWLHTDGDEATDEEAAEFEKGYEETLDEPADWMRTAYRDRWEPVQFCLTRAGAEAYIACNGHNLGETRIYVDSAHRNHEIQLLQKTLPELVNMAVFLMQFHDPLTPPAPSPGHRG